MKRLSLLTLVFAVLSAVFFLLLIFFRTPFPFYPLMSYQDVLDLLTPLVLIPVYWLLFIYSANGKSSRSEEIAFMVMAAVWVLGQGMHLSANSIDNLAEKLAKSQVLDITGTSIYTLTYFFDENLSHYLWHGGVLGLVALLSYREWRRPAHLTTTWWVTLLAGLVYGFTSFCIFLEGNTVWLGFPFVIIFTLLTIVWGRKELSQRPLLAFFLVASLVAVVLFTGWGVYWRGFPEFSKVGLI